MFDIIQELDWNILYFIQTELRSGAMDAVMKLISLAGNAGIIFFLTAGVLLIFRSYRRCGANILLAMAAGAVLANLIMKPLIARDRPCWLDESIQLLVAQPHDHSFPSGHTLHAFLVATVIFLYDKRIGIPALIIAAVMGFSRIYLFVHFPSDVICGALIGAAVAVGCYFLLKALTKKFPRLSELLPERNSVRE